MSVAVFRRAQNVRRAAIAKKAAEASRAAAPEVVKAVADERPSKPAKAADGKRQ